MTTNYLDVADGGLVLDELADSKPKPSICSRFCHSHVVAELVVSASSARRRRPSTRASCRQVDGGSALLRAARDHGTAVDRRPRKICPCQKC